MVGVDVIAVEVTRHKGLQRSQLGVCKKRCSGWLWILYTRMLYYYEWKNFSNTGI